jgi:hypothetical protein
LVFTGLSFDIRAIIFWPPSGKYKIVSWKKKSLKTSKISSFSLRLYFVIAEDSLCISTMYYLLLYIMVLFLKKVLLNPHLSPPLSPATRSTSQSSRLRFAPSPSAAAANRSYPISRSTTTNWVFFLSKRKYIELASRLIKNLSVPLGTLVRKRVRLKLTAHNIVTSFISLSRIKLGGSSTQLQVWLFK